MEEMDIDDYSRDRSRSPVRDRSRSPSRRRSYSRDRDSGASRSYSRKDEGYSRGRYGDRGDYSRGEYSRGSRGSRGGRGGRGGRGSRGGRGGSRSSRDYVSNRDDYYSNGTDDYKLKTERNYDNSIFVGNIPFGCTSRDVEEIFKGELDIVRADIVTNRGRSRGMATVEFSNKEDVRKAIEKYDHHEFQGREIFVRQDYPPPSEKRGNFASPMSQSRSSYSENERQRSAHPIREKFNAQSIKPGTEIFVGNLPFSVNWQALKDLMRSVGQVIRADVRTDRWGKSRGFGTVIFSTEEEAKRAVEEFQGYEIEGRKLDTRPGRSHSQEDSLSERANEQEPEEVRTNSEFTADCKGEGELSNTIYAENLPSVTTVDDLYELFETIGKVNRAEIQYDVDGKPSGNAVIEFDTEDLASLAISNLDTYNYGGNDLKISFVQRP